MKAKETPSTSMNDMPLEILNRFEFETADVIKSVVGLPGVRKSFANPINFFDLMLRGDDYWLVNVFLAGAHKHLSKHEEHLVRSFINEMVGCGMIPERVASTFWIIEKISSRAVDQIYKLFVPTKVELHFLYHLLFRVGPSFEESSLNVYTDTFRAVLHCFMKQEYELMDGLASKFRARKIGIADILKHEKVGGVFKMWAFERLIKWNCDPHDSLSVIHVLADAECVKSLCTDADFSGTVSKLIKFGLKWEDRLLDLTQDYDMVANVANNVDFMLASFNLERHEVLKVMRKDYNVPSMQRKDSMIFFFVQEKIKLSECLHLIPRAVYLELDVDQMADYLMEQVPVEGKFLHDKEFSAVLEVTRRVAVGEAMEEPSGSLVRQLASPVTYGVARPIKPAALKAIRRLLHGLTGDRLVRMCEFYERFNPKQIRRMADCFFVYTDQYDNLIRVLGRFKRLPKLFLHTICIDYRRTIALLSFIQGNGPSGIGVFFNDMREVLVERGKRVRSQSNTAEFLDEKMPEMVRRLRKSVWWHKAALESVLNHDLASAFDVANPDLVEVTLNSSHDRQSVTLQVPRKTRIVDLYSIVLAQTNLFPNLLVGFLKEDGGVMIGALIPLEDLVEKHPIIILNDLDGDGELADFSAQLGQLKERRELL